MVKLHSIDTGYFKLDGGAMYGVVPKRLWNKLNPADEINMCTWAMRCLLVDEGDRKILIDTGMGDKHGEKFKSHFMPHGNDTLKSSLAKIGLAPEDITDVLLTHFHFDHVGGNTELDANGKIVPTFPNATYWTNEVHYKWALEPNPRELASFLKHDFVPLREMGMMEFIDVEKDISFSKSIKLRFAYGHTEAMMIPIIDTGEKKIAFGADLLPSYGHIGMPYVMCYDIRPLDTMAEKAEFFDYIHQENIAVFLEHDKDHECLTITKNDRGRYVLDQTFKVDQRHTA
jgi:glyoxylase-like metal-dependent hydrolase (beta-lactamase superfamily II)